MTRRKRRTKAVSDPCFCTFWCGGNREIGSWGTAGRFIGSLLEGPEGECP